jgi:hypothetical protein
VPEGFGISPRINIYISTTYGRLVLAEEFGRNAVMQETEVTYGILKAL